jgi:hypothetical protein
MRFPLAPSQILGLHHFWRGSIHGPTENLDSYRMEETGYHLRRTMLLRFCELLSNLHPKLFQDCHSIDPINLQRQVRVECGSKPSVATLTLARDQGKGGLQTCGPISRPGSHITCSRECKECEGANPHTPK